MLYVQLSLIISFVFVVYSSLWVVIIVISAIWISSSLLYLVDTATWNNLFKYSETFSLENINVWKKFIYLFELVSSLIGKSNVFV